MKHKIMLSKEGKTAHVSIDPESVPQAEGVLFAFFPHIHVLVTVRWFSPLLLGLMIKSPWSRVSIIFSAWLKLILWKLGKGIQVQIFETFWILQDLLQSSGWVGVFCRLIVLQSVHSHLASPLVRLRVDARSIQNLNSTDKLDDALRVRMGNGLVHVHSNLIYPVDEFTVKSAEQIFLHHMFLRCVANSLSTSSTPTAGTEDSCSSSLTALLMSSMII
ncbi:hypothetical protein EYF80_041517 [Liparis tanakae]|uniref:Uncharacterized protein n=1 Tax=Liparis tanakae TaxID=230148 RepID=A0A4Z2G403_9TELE|nr:hypothetical protein EYF80_041517 [Liparis tanakae]